MRLPRFDYLEPETLAKACGLLQIHSGESQVVAGGTDLLVAMKQKRQKPKYLIALDKIHELKEIKSEDKAIIIGPLTSLQDIADSPLVRSKLPMLAQAAWEIGSPLIRSIATIGGNLCLDNRCRFYNQTSFWRQANDPCRKAGGVKCLVTGQEDRCHATFSSDVAPVLIALGAHITLRNADGESAIPLADFYTGKGESPNRADGSILTSIQIPLPREGTCGIYRKYRKRESIDFPLVGVAVTINLKGTTCTEAQIVLTGVGSGPVIASNAANKLIGHKLNPQVVSACAEAAVKGIAPFRTDLSTPGYKRKIVGLLVAESILELGGIRVEEGN
ncbi:MAG: FAD binding domain-containing protein [Desulfitobacteriaceae bacterium]